MTADPTLPSPSPPGAAAAKPGGEDGFNLPKLLGTFKRKLWILMAFSLAMGAYMAVKNAQQIPEYQSSFRLLVEPVRDARDLSRLTDSQQSSAPKEMDYSTQIEVLLSPEVLEPMLKQVQDRYPEANYGGVIGSLSVVRLGETKILEVRYTDTNPDKISALLEVLSQGYLEYSLNSQRTQLLQGLTFVDERLPRIQARVNNLGEELQNLQQEFDFIDPKDHSDSLFSQLDQVTQQRQALQTDFAALQIEYEALLKEAGATQALGQSANYQAMLQQYQSLRQDLALESARFGSQSPTIQLLQRQQANLAPLLQQEAERVLTESIAATLNALQKLIAQDQELARTETNLRDKIQVMPAVSHTYDELNRELALATNSLTRFLETKEVLQIQASQNEVPWELITPPQAVQQKPGTSLIKMVLMGAMLGVGLGAALAYVLEKLENTYYSVEEVRKQVPLPVLGLIPFHPELINAESEAHVVDLRQNLRSATPLADDISALKSQLKTVMRKNWTGGNSSNGKFAEMLAAATAAQEEAQAESKRGDRWLAEYDGYGFMESFRALHANLLPYPVRSIVLTSALPGEGATTVAAHLVQAASAMGRRVLLVDAQFRRGGTRLDALLGIRREIGLSEYLLERASLNQIIQRLSWESNLFAVSCGGESADPTRLLASARMIDLMERLDKVFDLVVYTMPPLMGLADVGLVAAQTDGVLLVTALGKRQIANALSATLERLQVTRTPVLGLVVNRVKNYSVDLYVRV